MRKRNVHMHFCSEVPGYFGATAITLYPNIYYARSLSETPKCLLKHELVHIEQVEKSNPFMFYISYVWDWLLKTIENPTKDAYWMLKKEKEAYVRQMEGFTLRDREILLYNDITDYEVKA